MPNNTLLDRYKRAIKAKYEEEKEGEYYYYLYNPSRGKLRDLCWIIFDKEKNQDDLNAFSTLLGLPFDRTKKSKFNEQKDKFRPIETFFKGETDPTNVDAINLAAILVDFQPRPYNKFRREDLNDAGSQKKEIYVDRSEEENKDEYEEKINKQNFDAEITKPQSFTNTIKTGNIKSRFFERLLNRSKSTMISIAIIFVLIAAVIYYAFIKKDCMQWAGDHFEVVDCTLEVKTGENKVEQLDKNLLDFKKIEVCDTTTCFKTNGEPIIWYSKSDNKVTFFNMDGKNPLNGKELSPITDYMFNKYKGDCKTKKSGPAH